MIKIGGAAVLRGRSSLLLWKMDMNDRDAAFARMTRMTIFRFDMDM